MWLILPITKAQSAASRARRHQQWCAFFGLHLDLPDPPRIARVGTQAFLGAEVQILFDREAEPSANARQLLRADPGQFGFSQARAA